MSITEMRYNEKNKSLEVTIKLFTDDIEKALESKSDSALFLGTEKEASQTDQLMEAYLKEHFSIKQNEEEMYYDYLGKEVDRDYTWLYIEVQNFSPDQKHELKHSMLTDLFEDQKNQINYYFNEKVHTLNLHRGKLRGTF